MEINGEGSEKIKWLTDEETLINLDQVETVRLLENRHLFRFASGQQYSMLFENKEDAADCFDILRDMI